MAITIDSEFIQSIPNVAGAWTDHIKSKLFVAVRIGEAERALQFDLSAHIEAPDSLNHWVAFEVMRAAWELREIDAVTKRLTA